MFTQALHDKIIVLIGHGSRLVAANRDFENLVQAYSQRWSGLRIKYAYLELAQPTMATVLEEAAILAHKEKRGLLLAPLLLFQGAHFQRDISKALHDLRQAHPQIKLYLSDVLGVHPNLSQLAYKRACQTSLLMPSSRSEKIALLYFGRGSKMESVRKSFEKQALLFMQAKGFGSSYSCFAAMQSPSLEDALRMAMLSAVKPQIEEILIIPHLLFFGSLLENVQKQIAAFQSRYPQVNAALAQPLGAEIDELLFSVLDERILNARLKSQG